MDLKQIFIELAEKYCSDQNIINTCWKEIEKEYIRTKRYYHNLNHLSALIVELEECQGLINDRDLTLFSVFYHDLVYNVLKSNNEEKSAEVAQKRLSQINFPRASECTEQILATKNHRLSSRSDTNLFTDADLSILGQPPNMYRQYCLQIRKEYSIYPDLVYKPGRRKVVNHFIEMPRIFKTDHFFNKYEHQARLNLKDELEIL